jgi:hypothetical protein
MAFALSALIRPVTPIGTLIRRLIRPTHQPDPQPQRPARAPARANVPLRHAALQPKADERPRARVRVLRLDAPQAPAAAGRILISGRMADVCDELDRLAAMEASSCRQQAA